MENLLSSSLSVQRKTYSLELPKDFYGGLLCCLVSLSQQQDLFGCRTSHHLSMQWLWTCNTQLRRSDMHNNEGQSILDPLRDEHWEGCGVTRRGSIWMIYWNADRSLRASEKGRVPLPTTPSVSEPSAAAPFPLPPLSRLRYKRPVTGGTRMLWKAGMCLYADPTLFPLHRFHVRVWRGFYV